MRAGHVSAVNWREMKMSVILPRRGMNIGDNRSIFWDRGCKVEFQFHLHDTRAVDTRSWHRPSCSPPSPGATLPARRVSGMVIRCKVSPEEIPVHPSGQSRVPHAAIVRPPPAILRILCTALKIARLQVGGATGGSLGSPMDLRGRGRDKKAT